MTLQLGQTQQAREFYQKSLGVRQRLADADPKNAEAQRDLSVSFNNLGDVTLQLGQTKEALEFYQKSLGVRQRLADADPKNTQAQRDLCVSFQRLGDVTLQLGKTKEALGFYQKGLGVIQRLADADPNNAEAQRDLSVSFSKLGDVMRQLGQPQQALEFYQKSLGVIQRLADADPKNAEAQRDLSLSHWKLALVHEQTQEFQKALEEFQKAEKLAIGFSKPGFYEDDLPWLRWKITNCQNALKAIADIEFVFQQQPEQIPGFLALRVNFFLARQQPAEAVKTAERFAAWAETLNKKLRDGERYNAACVYALCAAAIEKDREPLVEQSLGLLQKAKAGGYFNAKRIAHIKKDKNFDGIRTHPKFVAFMKELEKQPEVAPPPMEKK